MATLDAKAFSRHASQLYAHWTVPLFSRFSYRLPTALLLLFFSHVIEAKMVLILFKIVHLRVIH